MKRFLLILSAWLLLLPSCVEREREEVATPLAEGNFSLSLKADLPEMPQVDGLGEEETKAIAQYTVRIQWKEGDRISVVNLTRGKLLGGCLTADKAGTSSTFSGTLSGTVKTGDRLAFFYPAQDNTAEIAFQGIHVDLSSQKGTLNDVPLCVCSVTTAESNSFRNASISFDYLMCYMLIAMSDIPAGAKVVSVTLTNVTNALDFQINQDKTGFDSTPTRGDIVLNPGNTANGEGARTVYMAIPASEKESYRSLILNTETASFEAAFGASAISNGKAYNTNVTGFLTDDLAFEDVVLRTYCLAHFDRNGDGKLSMVEIASWSSFPEDLPSGILCFDELEYFYGLTALPSFSGQTELTEITVPKQITAIPAGTFSGCSSLTELRMMPATPPSLGSDALRGTPENQLIIVPDEAISSYCSASGWSNYASRIRGVSSISGSNVRINTENETMGT